VLATVLAYWMTPEGYGAFVMAYHALRLVAVSTSLGLGQAGIRYIPILLRKNALTEFRGIFRFGFLFNLIGPALLIGAVLKLTPWVTSHSAGYQVRVLIPLASILAINLFLSGVLRGLGHPLAANLSSGALREGLLALLVFLFYFEGGTVEETGALRALLLASVCMLFGQIVVLWKDRRLLFGPAEYAVGKWVRNALPFHWLSILRLLISTAEILLVGTFLGEAAAGAYHLAMTWAGWAMIPFTTAGAIYPRTLAVVGRHRVRKLMQIAMFRSTRFAVFQSPFVVGIAFLTMDHTAPNHGLALTLLIPLYVARTMAGGALLMVTCALSRGLIKPLIRASTIITFSSILLSYYLCIHSTVLVVAIVYMLSRSFSVLVYSRQIKAGIRTF
jgi:O-antigen/teichoic acid export membrane protein